MLDVMGLSGVSALSTFCPVSTDAVSALPMAPLAQMRVASVSPMSVCTPTPTSAKGKGSPLDWYWNATESYMDVFDTELAEHEREKRR